MSRYVIMGTDECGQEFNAGGCYYSCREEADAALAEVANRYEEARGFWVEPLFSDVCSARSFDDEDLHYNYDEDY